MKIENIKKSLQNEGILILIIVGLLVILVFFKFNPLSFKSNGLASAEIIVLNGCGECFDINKITQSLKDQGNFDIEEVTNLNYDSKALDKVRHCRGLYVPECGIQHFSTNERSIGTALGWLRRR